MSSLEGFEGEATDTRELRAIDLVEAVDGAVERIDELTYRVRSSTGRGFYSVHQKSGEWTCECGDWDERHLPCKHVFAVTRTIDPNPPTLVEVLPERVADRYTQDWPAYDAAQQAEHPMFDALLWDLLEQVAEPQTRPGKRGRKPVPVRTQLLVAIKKVHLVESCRRTKGLLETIYSGGEGVLSDVPNYAVPSRFFNRPETTLVLLDLIRRSSGTVRIPGGLGDRRDRLDGLLHYVQRGVLHGEARSQSTTRLGQGARRCWGQDPRRPRR